MSTFGSVPFSMVETNADFMVSSSNKCLEGAPGFSYAICNTRKLLAAKGKKIFHNFYESSHLGIYIVTPTTSLNLCITECCSFKGKQALTEIVIKYLPSYRPHHDSHDVKK